MEFDADAYELGEYFAEPLATYQLLLPRKWRMMRLIRRTTRTVRRQSIAYATMQFRRPLNEEDGYTSVTRMSESDHTQVRGILQRYFDTKNLKVSELELNHLRQVDSDLQEPYDLVEATFTVRKQTFKGGY